jgi:hypothetical protein
LKGNLCCSVGEVGDPPAEFASGAEVRARWCLDVCLGRDGEGQGDDEEGEKFHAVQLVNEVLRGKRKEDGSCAGENFSEIELTGFDQLVSTHRNSIPPS